LAKLAPRVIAGVRRFSIGPGLWLDGVSMTSDAEVSRVSHPADGSVNSAEPIDPPRYFDAAKYLSHKQRVAY